MAIRGAICRWIPTENTFKGVRHSRAAEPPVLGKALWDAYHGFFERDIARMIQYLTVDHPAGWSTLAGADFTPAAGYVASPKSFGPKCLCHGPLSGGEFVVDAAAVFAHAITWTYILRDDGTMSIWPRLDDTQITAEQMIENAVTIDFNEEEPDWSVVQCGKKLERCSHRADEHFPATVGTPSAGIRAVTYAGYRNPTIYDVVAIIRGGHRYTLNGKVKAGNGYWHAWGYTEGHSPEEEHDFQIGAWDKAINDYRPAGDCIWIYPPFKTNKKESSSLDYPPLAAPKKLKKLPELDRIIAGQRRLVARDAVAFEVPVLHVRDANGDPVE